MLYRISPSSYIPALADNDSHYGGDWRFDLFLGDDGSIPTRLRLALAEKSLEDDDDFIRSGYQQKDRKTSQNDKTEHGMEKTVQNQSQSPKMPKSESILKNQQSLGSREKN
ncbi:hypothetical protein Tco_1162840 [Tanacetum coccineum]